ncbi:hypothetical protein ALC53_05402 [Atta colombica]|uniref:Uncharacterized protein n=1 Tax=Atta colombica TaxID=520822 RepID=A0A195BIZ5_9HYME|nr:hypothetical protein ALC53_05402 [Atta colombica]
MFVTRIIIALHYTLLKIDSRILVYSLHINVRSYRSLPDFKETPSSDLRRRGHYVRGLSNSKQRKKTDKQSRECDRDTECNL